MPCRHSQEFTISFSRAFIKLAYVRGRLHMGVQKPSPLLELGVPWIWCLGKHIGTLKPPGRSLWFWGPQGLVCAHLSNTPPPPAQHHTLGSYNTTQLWVAGALHLLSGLHICAYAMSSAWNVFLYLQSHRSNASSSLKPFLITPDVHRPPFPPTNSGPFTITTGD